MADDAAALDFDLAMTYHAQRREQAESEQLVEQAGPMGLLLSLMSGR